MSNPKAQEYVQMTAETWKSSSPHCELAGAPGQQACRDTYGETTCCNNCILNQVRRAD